MDFLGFAGGGKLWFLGCQKSGKACSSDCRPQSIAKRFF
jgi:hypothetical protein